MLWVTHCLLFLSHAASAVAVRGKAKTSTALPVSISNRTVKATQRCESRFLRECRPDDVAPRGHESHVVVPRWSHQVSVWGCGRAVRAAVVALGWSVVLQVYAPVSGGVAANHRRRFHSVSILLSAVLVSTACSSSLSGSVASLDKQGVSVCLQVAL